jgi:hypothetical protein
MKCSKPTDMSSQQGHVFSCVDFALEVLPRIAADGDTAC